MPTNFDRANVAAAIAVIAVAALSGCAAKAAPSTPPPAQTAGIALQAANDQIRSDFKDVVSMNAATVGGMPCDRGCWALKHLENDDMGRIATAYRTAVAAYEDGGEAAPGEIEQWKTAMETVQAGIKAWDRSTTMTGGFAAHSPQTKSKVLADLDRADALVDQFAPASVRAATASAR